MANIGAVIGYKAGLTGLPLILTGGIFGGVMGGRRGAVIGGVVHGLLITFLPAILVPMLESYNFRDSCAFSLHSIAALRRSDHSDLP
jgi:hypothetical protein